MFHKWHLINPFNFKFVKVLRSGTEDNDSIKNILNCIEYGIDSYPVHKFYFDYFGEKKIEINKKIKLTSIVDLLPDIKHFIKYGDKCATRCHSECFYCDKKAEALSNFLKKSPKES